MPATHRARDDVEGVIRREAGMPSVAVLALSLSFEAVSSVKYSKGVTGERNQYGTFLATQHFNREFRA